MQGIFHWVTPESILRQKPFVYLSICLLGDQTKIDLLSVKDQALSDHMALGILGPGLSSLLSKNPSPLCSRSPYGTDYSFAVTASVCPSRLSPLVTRNHWAAASVGSRT